MICVSIGRARHKRMIAEHQFLAQEGASLVELRLDYLSRSVDLKRLLVERPTPVVATVRRRDDGGRWMKSEEERVMLLRSAIASGVEYVDIEADIAGSIPRYGQTKRIISYHDFSGTPDNLEDLHAAMAEEDADIVKIATMANTFSDNVRMLRLAKNAKVPTIAICMGEMGMITRILGKRFGAPFTYATFSEDKRLAPGQLHWKEMNRIYHYDQINDQTELFGVIADPVAHSYSPLIHNTAFHSQGINACYLPLRVPADNLHVFMDHCDELGIVGLSVTIPHKERVLDYCTQAEAAAGGIGAINTMLFQGDRTLGYNTDYRAAMDCVGEIFQLKKDVQRPMQGLSALLLGAGGVSRAIAWGLKQRGCRVVIASRTRERAELMASDLQCEVIDWEQRYEPRVNLLINGTPIGMHPDVESTPYGGDKLNHLMVVFDTVYNPENTLLIKHAKRAGCRIITGIDMFVRQAAYQYKLFTGKEAPVELIRKTIKDATNPVQLN